MRKLLLALLSLALTSSVGAQSCCDRDGLREVDEASAFWYPFSASLYGVALGTAATNCVIDLTDDRCHMNGIIHWNGGGTHTCSSSGCTIQWLPGAVTWANTSSVLDIGLQDTDTANGPPGRGDGTFDVSVTYNPTGGANPHTITANTWNTATMASGSKSIAHGSHLTVGINFTTRAGSDSIVVSGLVVPSSYQFPMNVLAQAGTFGALSSPPAPNVIITADDGTLGWLEGSVVYSSVASTNYNSGSTPDERALLCKIPFDVSVNGVGAFINLAGNTSDWEFVFYRNPTSASPTALKTITNDANISTATGGRYYWKEFDPPVILKGGETYAVSVRPTSANNLNIAEHTVSAAAHLAAWPGGTDCYQGTRSDQSGAFSATTTIRPAIWMKVNKISNVRR